MNKKILSIVTIVGLFVIYLSMSSSSNGINGQSAVGCGGGSCHGAANANTTIALAGFPTNYVNGQSYNITVSVNHSTQVEAGFDLSVTGGTISLPGLGAALNGTTEIRHNTPKTITAGSASWTFTWTAPATGTAVITCFVAGNAANNNGTTSGDAWTTSSQLIGAPIVNLAVTATTTNILCNGGTSTIVATGTNGTAPYQYKINAGTYQSSGTFIGNTAGTYTITVKDASNATASTVKTITQPNQIIAPISSTNILCFGTNNATAQITPTGGTGAFTYSWSPIGGTAALATNLNAGTYTCTVTDVNGCTKTATTLITQPLSAPSVSIISSTNVGCNTGATGAATASASGGTGALTYGWNPGLMTTASVANLTAGTYTCIAMDANQCTTATTITITQNAAIVPSITSNNILCFGQSNGSASITSTGGAGGFSYIWAPSGGSASTASNLVAGVYTCTITDANLCTKTTIVAITQPPALTLTFLQGNVNCKNGSDGFVTAAVTGGTGVYTYSWLPSGAGVSIAGLVAGSYTCNVVDANGCSASQVATVAGSNDTANANYTKALNVLSAIQPNANYQWLKCDPNLSIIPNAITQNFTIPAGGNYALIVSSGNCRDTSVCKPITAVGIHNTTLDNNFLSMIYPGYYNYLNSSSAILNYTLSNTQGAILQKGKMQIGDNKILINNFANGVYFLETNGRVYKLIAE
jgi:hypothetical protein